MIDLAKAREIAAARTTKGVWPVGLAQSPDNKFIAYFGTHADDLLDEIEALRLVAEAAREAREAYTDESMPMGERQEAITVTIAQLDYFLKAWRNGRGP